MKAKTQITLTIVAVVLGCLMLFFVLGRLGSSPSERARAYDQEGSSRSHMRQAESERDVLMAGAVEDFEVATRYAGFGMYKRIEYLQWMAAGYAKLEKVAAMDGYSDVMNWVAERAPSAVASAVHQASLAGELQRF